MAYQRFLETGQIVSTHGIKGEVRIQPWCHRYYGTGTKNAQLHIIY